MRSAFLVPIAVVIACGSNSPPAQSTAQSSPPPATTSTPASASASPSPSPSASSTSPTPSPSVAAASTGDPCAPAAPKKPMTEKEKRAAELAAQAEAMQQEAIAVVDGRLTTVRIVPQPQPCAVAASDAGASSASNKKGDVQIGGSKATNPVADADRVVAGMRPQFRNCYSKGLDKDPFASGAVKLEIRVAPNGEVSNVESKDAVGLPSDVVACMKGAAKRAMFSAPGGGGSTITVPLTCFVAK